MEVFGSDTNVTGIVKPEPTPFYSACSTACFNTSFLGGRINNDSGLNLTDVFNDTSQLPAVNTNATFPDLSKIKYPGTFEYPPAWEASLKISLYIIVILVSFVGNSLVIYIVWKNRRMRTTTNYYIVNLAVADLLVTLTCSWVHVTDDLTEGWVLGSFFCKLNTFSQVLALVSSIMTLTLISCDRFFGIVFAMKAHLTERRATSCILLVWICAAAVSAPHLVYREQQSRVWANHVEVWCGDADTWPTQVSRDQSGRVVDVRSPSRIIYYTFVTVVLFFLPIAVMTTAYSFIVWRLWSSNLPGEQLESGKVAQDKVKRKVAMMLLVLLVLFVACWLPLQAAILYSEYRPNKLQPLPVWYPVFKYTATFVAYSNSAVNPVIYAGFNENFQKGFCALFRSRRRVSRQYSSVVGSSVIRRDSSFQTTMVTRI